MRAITVDWLSHWIVIVMGGAVGLYWGWWGLLGAVIGWTVINLVYRLGVSNTDRDSS